MYLAYRVDWRTLAGLGVSPGGFRAESRTVLGKAQALRVEASQGFYYSGFIQPNKQTIKQTLQKDALLIALLPHNLSLFTP